MPYVSMRSTTPVTTAFTFTEGDTPVDTVDPTSAPSGAGMSEIFLAALSIFFTTTSSSSPSSPLMPGAPFLPSSEM
jgi:hypothetical protein